MPGVQDPISGLWQGYDDDESGWADQITSNFLKIGAIIRLVAISKSLTAPPGLPDDGDLYIIAPAATGAWLGEDGNVAVWRADPAAWEFYEPKDGWTAVLPTVGTWGTQTVFKGGVWSPGIALG